MSAEHSCSHRTTKKGSSREYRREYRDNVIKPSPAASHPAVDPLRAMANDFRAKYMPPGM